MKEAPQSSLPLQPTLASQSSLADALDALWTRFLPEMEERVATLEAAALAFKGDNLSEEQRENAHAVAHKLAGVLGIFGLTEGTELARELETIYSRRSVNDPALAEQMAGIAAQLRASVESKK